MAKGEVDSCNLPKRRLLIDERFRDAIRNGTARTEELALLRRRSFIWVKAHREELSPTECQDLISAALLDVLPLIQDPAVEILEIDLEFRRALGTQRTAAKRRVRRFIGMDDLDQLVSGDATTEDVEREIIQMDHLLKVVRTLKSLIAIAVDLLPSRSHDLIVEEYNLVPLGFSMRNPESLALSEGAYRVALFRARKRFHQILGIVYGAVQTTLQEESSSLKASMQASSIDTGRHRSTNSLSDCDALYDTLCGAFQVASSLAPL